MRIWPSTRQMVKNSSTGLEIDWTVERLNAELSKCQDFSECGSSFSQRRRMRKRSICSQNWMDAYLPRGPAY